MNVVFLSPHFPSHYFRFCLNLKAAGANVLGVGDEPFDNLSQEVRTSLTEYYQVDDMHDYNALVRACGFFTHRYGIPVFYTVHTFSQGIMETVNEARHISYYSLRDIPPTLEKIGRECLKTFNVKEGFFSHRIFPDSGRPICGAGGKYAAAGWLHDRYV